MTSLHRACCCVQPVTVDCQHLPDGAPPYYRVDLSDLQFCTFGDCLPSAEFPPGHEYCGEEHTRDAIHSGRVFGSPPPSIITLPYSGGCHWYTTVPINWDHRFYINCDCTDEIDNSHGEYIADTLWVSLALYQPFNWTVKPYHWWLNVYAYNQATEHTLSRLFFGRRFMDDPQVDAMTGFTMSNNAHGYRLGLDGAEGGCFGIWPDHFTAYPLVGTPYQVTPGINESWTIPGDAVITAAFEE